MPATPEDAKIIEHRNYDANSEKGDPSENMTNVQLYLITNFNVNPNESKSLNFEACKQNI